MIDTSIEGAVFTQLELPNVCSKLYSADCTGESVYSALDAAGAGQKQRHFSSTNVVQPE